jgi:hypothetical protein
MATGTEYKYCKDCGRVTKHEYSGTWKGSTSKCTECDSASFHGIRGHGHKSNKGYKLWGRSRPEDWP